MIQPNAFYNLSSRIESNTIFNRCLMDIGGWEAPLFIMANNDTERKERASKSALYVLGTFASPLLLMPFLNKRYLCKNGIIEKFKDKGLDIIQLSNKHLTGTTEQFIDGIKELGKELKREKEFKNILDNFKGREHELKDRMIKIKSNIMQADMLATTLFIGAIPWYINDISRLITGRKGYSGEFLLADKNYTDKMNQKHDKMKPKLMLGMAGAIIANSIFWPAMLKKGMLSKSPNKFLKFFKNNAAMFDYKKGIFMSLATYALLELFGDSPSWILATRDKHERRNMAIQLLMGNALFFGGDFVLNNVAGRTFDKFCGTKLINREKFSDKSSFFKKLLMPTNSLEKLKKMEVSGEKSIAKTKKYALGMYWGNFLLIMMGLGFGVPYLTNRLLRIKVKEDLEKEKNTQKR